jgi:hypothetical protein
MPVLRRLRLESLHAVRDLAAPVVHVAGDRRDVLRIETDGPDGRGTAIFVKRTFRAHGKDAARSILLRGRVLSAGRAEWEGLRALRSVGFAAPRPVAAGEEWRLLSERFSYVVTEELRGGRPVDAVLERERDPGTRRAILEAVGREARRLHDAGFRHKDLLARHVLVLGEEPVRLAHLDVARLVRGDSPPPFLFRTRDLAVLLVSLPRPWVADAERAILLGAYAVGGDDPARLVRFVSFHARRLLRRARTRRYHETGTP